MLASSAFLIGTPEEVRGLALLVPITQSSPSLLISRDGDQVFVIMIGDDHRFYAYEWRVGDRWKGLLVPGIAVEVDESSVFDIQREYVPYGALVRDSDRLSFAARIAGDHPIDQQRLIPLVLGLPQCADESGAGFRKWQIVVGDGTEKRVLNEFSVELADGPPR